ncbi:hypothetical protein [Dyadobacter sp. CY312]|uniref:hypothetical protein n=1 Tax=Dyadobacter sp. CY312 TaxID=2907303 RepID=UPI001F45D004|nr:hypothetical protein [Dyadobacter sp. CY312]MCE7039756.1 hypothetical protein [Dyadobacter sp. CY312]
MKYLRYIFLALGAMVWMVGLSPYLSRKLSRTDSYRYGDLYRLSNLSEFKDPAKRCEAYSPPVKKTSRKIHLYVIGDSFTEEQRIGKADFLADSYTRISWNEVLHVKPDSSAINILLIESVERHFREKFSDHPIGNIIPDSASFIAAAENPGFMHTLDGIFSSKSTEGRLDEFLFQNNFILSLKELKANFNNHVFGRVNKEVVPIKGGTELVYYMDTDEDTTETTSSFAEIENAEIDTLVRNLNESEKLALELGFDKVLLSIIPNKVSVLMPEYGQYNNLIERVYKHPDLSVEYLDVYTLFRQMGAAAYLKGDSHWTCQGQYLWLNKVNNTINKITDGN